MKIIKLAYLVSLVSAAVTAQDTAIFDAQSEKFEKWVETRKLISEEREAWRVGSEMLQSRIELVENEKKELTEHIRKLRDGVYDADRELLDLKKQRELLQESVVGLTLVVHEIEVRTVALLDRCPLAIRDRVKPLLQRIPNSRDSKNSLAERFQSVIGVLNEVNKFARDITVSSEVKELPAGESAEVTALYIGIGAGYYYNDKGNIAGYGYPGATNWIWKSDDTLVNSVADAVSIYRNEKPAAYLSLPVRCE